MIKIKSIRTKFFFAVISIILFVSIFPLVFFVNRTDHLIEKELTELGFALVRNLSYSSQLPVASEDAILLRPYLSGISEEKDVVFAAVYNRKGKIITFSGKVELDEQLPEEIRNELSARRNIIQRKGTAGDGGEVYNFYSPVYLTDVFDLSPARDEKKLGGFARIVLSPERVKTQRRTIVTLGLGITLLVLLCSLGLSFLLARGVVGPIGELTESIRSIGRGDLNRSITVKSDDEIGELGTAFNKMTDELRAVQAQLVTKEKLVAMGQMASIVAHDLRNPLATMKNIGYMFNKLKMDEQATAKFSGMLLREVDAANRIVSDLLDFSREKHIKKALCCLDELVEGALKSSFLGANIRVSKDVSPSITVSVDPDAMKRVFLNVISNAAQAMPDGGELVIAARPGQTDVTVSVTDTGCGISPEVLKRIFEPFFTTRKKGTGLGMAIILNIVNQHDGTIGVESVEGKGTTVHIVLPLDSEREKEGNQ